MPSTPAATSRGGSGVIVLPCGAGKTIVGLAAMAALQTETLVLTTSTTAVEQWRREILDKTDLDDALVATYTGESKTIAPVTLATYQIVTYRPKKDGDFPHFHLFNERDWGLIIYDEVHLLPAPVFRVTAEIQARRRLGLTATLVREDGREEDVFSLIGPKKFDVPWRVLESKGWIAEAQCHEVRLGLPAALRMEYAVAEWRDKFRLASENPVKDDLVGCCSSGTTARGPRAGHRPVSQAIAADRRAVRHPADHRPDAQRRARGSLRQVPQRRDPPAGPLQGRQLRHRPARRQRDDPGFGHVRQPPGRSPAAGADPPAQGRRGPAPLLHAGDPRHPRAGLRPPSPALPDRAGLQLRDPGRIRSARSGLVPAQRPADRIATAGSVLGKSPLGGGSTTSTRGRSTMIPSTARIPVKLHKNVTLLRTSEPVLAEELLARKALARWVLGRLSETVLLVQPDQSDAVIEELRRMGHTPRVVR